MAPTVTTNTPAASRRIKCHGCGRAMRSRLLAGGETHRHYCQPCLRDNQLCEVYYHHDKHANGRCGKDAAACAYCGSRPKTVHGPGEPDAGRAALEDEGDGQCSALEYLCPVWFEKLHRGMYDDLGDVEKDVIAEAWGWSAKYREGGHFCQNCIAFRFAILYGSQPLESDVWLEVDRLGTAESFAEHYLEAHFGREEEEGYGPYYSRCQNMLKALDGIDEFAFRWRQMGYDGKRDGLLMQLGEMRKRFVSDMHYKNNAAHVRELYDEVMEQFDSVEKNLREWFAF